MPASVSALSHLAPYGDLAAIEALFAKHPGEFAAVILEPMNTAEPPPGYLQGLKELVHRHGALLIFDEIITGFRWSIGGAQARYGVTPDLACFGKAMGNGMPISAVVGRADIMRLMEDIFYSGTFGGETLSLAAAIATIDKIEREKRDRAPVGDRRRADDAGARTHRGSRPVRRARADRCRALGDPDLQGSSQRLERGASRRCSCAR